MARRLGFYIEKIKTVLKDKNVRSALPTVLSAACMLLVLFYVAAGAMISTNGTQALTEELSKKLIRFHVVANSDSEPDQEVKLKVKESITSYLAPVLENAQSRDEAYELIHENLEQINAAANETLAQSGYAYSAHAQLGTSSFPVKKYGDIVLPAGDYTALKITLGNAQGRNWWCIMFPQLCFIDSTYSIVPDESKDKLKYLLTEEEYDAIVQGDIEVESHSFFLDFIRKLFGL